MPTHWQPVEVRGMFEIPGLPGARVEALPVFRDSRGSLHELYRADEIPPGFKPVMACCSWPAPGVTRGPHQHVAQDDYFTFAGIKLAEPATWETFARRVNHIRSELPALLQRLRAQGKRVIGYGASAKGNTLLNTCGLGVKELDCIIDNMPLKQNKLTPGSWIPIRLPERFLRDQRDFALPLAWNFASEIIRRETELQKCGGRFIPPIPEPQIVAFPR